MATLCEANAITKISDLSPTCFIHNARYQKRYGQYHMVNFLLSTVRKSFFSRKTEDGISQAGTHLIIIEKSPCGSTNAQKSNPAILNYYRQFMIKGNSDRSVAGIRYLATITYGP